MMNRLAACRVNALVWLLVLPLGCRPPVQQATEDHLAPEAQAAVERVLHLMRQRLLVMHDVARWKWNGQQPSADPERERVFLDSIAAKAKSANLDPEFTRTFFVAQIEAAKQLQEDDFRRWKMEGRGRFPDVPDLATQIRPKIDALSADLLGALAAVQPILGSKTARDQVRQQANEVLSADGITETIRETAIRPLMMLKR
jgi:chorismate mutase